MELPNDPMMLFSFINTKLRDNYSSLDELCDDMHCVMICTSVVRVSNKNSVPPGLNIIRTRISFGENRCCIKTPPSLRDTSSINRGGIHLH